MNPGNKILVQAVRSGLVAFLFLSILLATGCSPGGTQVATFSMELTAAAEDQLPRPIEPSPTPVLDTGWQLLQPGLERRVINLYSDEDSLIENLYLLRISPEHFRFGVGYKPGEPLTLEGWQQETGALIVLNGGFFDEDNKATGLVISDGSTSGQSYVGFGGMFAVDTAGPVIRWLQEEPYNGDEGIHSALQSFPMLVLPGGQLPPAADNGEGARRTVIAQDRSGRIVMVVSGLGRFSLRDMSRFLVNSDLDLDRALNLDGGASSGIFLTNPTEAVQSFSLLPTVVLVYNQ